MTAEPHTEVVVAQGFDLGEMVLALRQAGEDFVGLLRSLGPGDGERPVPDMKWTAAEVAVHLLTVVRRGMGDRRRADSIEGLAELNDRSITEVSERDPATLATHIEQLMQEYVGQLSRANEEDVASRTVRLHAGVRADIPTALSYQLFEFLVHGLDIARAVGKSWVIAPEHAVLVLRASLPALRPWVRDDVLAGPDRQAALAFRGSGTAIVVRTGNDGYQVHPGDVAAAQAVVDPVELLLAVGGRQTSANPHIAGFADWYRPI